MSPWVENIPVYNFPRMIQRKWLFFSSPSDFSTSSWSCDFSLCDTFGGFSLRRNTEVWQEQADRRYTDRVTRQDNGKLCVELLTLPGAQQFAKQHSSFTLNLFFPLPKRHSCFFNVCLEGDIQHELSRCCNCDLCLKAQKDHFNPVNKAIMCFSTAHAQWSLGPQPYFGLCDPLVLLSLSPLKGKHCDSVSSRMFKWQQNYSDSILWEKRNLLFCCLGTVAAGQLYSYFPLQLDAFLEVPNYLGPLTFWDFWMGVYSELFVSGGKFLFFMLLIQ